MINFFIGVLLGGGVGIYIGIVIGAEIINYIRN